MRRRRSSSSRQASAVEEDNSREAFDATCRLYEKLAVRALNNSCYLFRNLRRDYPRPPPTHYFPVVKYLSDEPGVSFFTEISHLRCLWCRGSIPRFWNSTELLHHLRTCHSMLAYRLHTAVADKPGRPVIISMRLLRGEEGALAAKIDRFHTYDMEEVYVNKRKFPNYLRATSCPSILFTNVDSEAGGHPLTNAGLKGPSEAKTKRTATKKKKRTPMGKPAFQSVKQAVVDGRLYHSTLQVPLSLENFEDGADSDNEDTEENLWRLELMDTEIEEFVDTIPVEKLFMILWNQFVRMEYAVRADRHVAPACMCFVKKYRKTLIRLSLETTFLRHMTELGRRGLVDADVTYACIKVLKDRDMSKREGEDETRFLFAERYEKQELLRKRLEQKKEQKLLPDGNGIDVSKDGGDKVVDLTR